MKNKSYIGISFIILVFGIIFIPRIVNRMKDDTVVENDRMSAGHNSNEMKSLVTIGQVPKFELTDENNKKIYPCFTMLYIVNRACDIFSVKCSGCPIYSGN